MSLYAQQAASTATAVCWVPGRSITYLLCEWHDLQVWVDAPEAVLLQLRLDVLRHQVDGNNVVTFLPRNDDVSVPEHTPQPEDSRPTMLIRTLMTLMLYIEILLCAQ
jgi:hypothetical protein